MKVTAYKYIVGALIALFTMTIASASESSESGDNPKPCSPYPLCKFMNQEKIQGDTSNRLMAPQQQTSLTPVIEQKAQEDELIIQKQDSIEK
jgi:hypothetical protein